MDGGRNFLPSLRDFVLSTIHGVILVPHAWLVAVISCTVSRAPGPCPEKRKPRLLCRPLSAFSALNHPKKAPLEPSVAVMANVPVALSFSSNVLAGIFCA